jgi:hypothetical protein
MTPITDPSHLDKLIDRQMQSWELRRRMAEKGGDAARKELAHLPEGPWITVSKQLGTDGIEIARRVGDRLGWLTFDKELLEAIARHARCRHKILSKMDERASGLFDNLFARWIAPEALSPSEYLRELTLVIFELGRQGRAVLVGRGANWLLDPRFGLRVRLVAPAEYRARHYADVNAVDASAAERAIREDDAALSTFIRRTYRKDIHDPLGYDLVLNVGLMTNDAAVETILAALHLKVGAAVEKAGRVSADRE